MTADLSVGLTAVEITHAFAPPELAAKFPPILTVDQAAELLQVPKKTLYHWREQNELAFVSRKVGKHIRFLRDRLLKWYFNDGQEAAEEPPLRDPIVKKLFGGKVTLFLRKRTWWVRYNLNGTQYKRSLRTRDDIEAHKRVAMVEQQLRSPQLKQLQSAPKIRDVIDLYLSHVETEGRAARTLAQYRHMLPIIASFAESLNITTLDQLDLTFADAFRKCRKAAGKAPKTLQNETILIKQLINFALRRDLISRNPLKALRLPKLKPSVQPFWTLSQVRTILDATQQLPYHQVYCLLAETGLRIAEARFLTWSDVDFEQKVLHIRPKRYGKGPRDEWKPKSGDQRAVPLSPELIAMLRSMPRRST